MAQKLKAAFPPDFDFPANFIVQLTAVDPTTGDVVSGVEVSNVAIVAEPVQPVTADTTPTIVPTTPEWINVPQSG